MTTIEFRTIYPSFLESTDFQINYFLGLFVTLYGSGLNDHLQGLYVAHRLTVSKQGSTKEGKITSESVGDISVSYSTETDITGMNSTPYGVEFSNLIAGFSGPMVAG